MALPIDRDQDGALEPERELAFADGNDRLPWLESDDDDREAGYDTGRIFAFAVVGLLAVLLLLGGLYWATRDRDDNVIVADGSTIEAPEGPYKTRPADPGGEQVAGTGQTSFEVAEGQAVEGRLAETPALRPSIDRQQAAAASPTPSPSASETPQPSGIGVQVGAYSSRAAAEAGWTQLSGRISPLQGRSHRIVEGRADSGTIYRLQATAGGGAEAEALCRDIKAAGGDCQVKR